MSRPGLIGSVLISPKREVDVELYAFSSIRRLIGLKECLGISAGHMRLVVEECLKSVEVFDIGEIG